MRAAGPVLLLKVTLHKKELIFGISFRSILLSKEVTKILRIQKLNISVLTHPEIPPKANLTGFGIFWFEAMSIGRV